MLESNTSPPSGQPLVGVAPHIKLLCRAADVDRDRLERELRVVRSLCGVGLLGLGRLGGVLCGGSGVELRLASVFAASSCVASSAALAAAFCFCSSARAWLRLLCRGEPLVGRRELGVSAGLGRFQLAQRGRDAAPPRAPSWWRPSSPRRADFAASAASRASVSMRAGAAAIASAFGMNSAGCEKSTGAASFGEMITRIPIRVLSNSFSAKPKGMRTQPCEAAYPGSGPPCSATPFQVMRCMFGIQASSYMLEWWSLSFSITAKMPAGVSRPSTPVDTGARISSHRRRRK